MKTILVTGGTGFIGLPCIERLVEGGDQVHVVCRTARGEMRQGIQVHALDLLDISALRQLMQAIRPTHLLHLAWNATPGKFWTLAENVCWVAASLQLLHDFAACGGQRAVLAGSCAEYSWSGGICSEASTPLEPRTLYGTCKDSLRTIAESFARQVGLSLAWARLFFLYGPREHPQRLVSSVILSLLQAQTAQCSEGIHERDFLHVNEAADALVNLLHSNLTGACNIASGSATPVRRVVSMIAEQLGRSDLVRFGALASPTNEPRVLYADVRRLREEAHWAPRFELANGLAQTIDWWRHHLAKR